MTTEHEKITDCVHAEVGRVADDCPWCHNRLLKLLNEKEELCKAQQKQIDLCKADIWRLREAFEFYLEEKYLTEKMATSVKGIFKETAIFEAESTNPENRESDKESIKNSGKEVG